MSPSTQVSVCSPKGSGQWLLGMGIGGQHHTVQIPALALTGNAAVGVTVISKPLLVGLRAVPLSQICCGRHGVWSSADLTLCLVAAVSPPNSWTPLTALLVTQIRFIRALPLWAPGVIIFWKEDYPRSCLTDLWVIRFPTQLHVLPWFSVPKDPLSWEAPCSSPVCDAGLSGH